MIMNQEYYELCQVLNEDLASISLSSNTD